MKASYSCACFPHPRYLPRYTVSHRTDPTLLLEEDRLVVRAYKAMLEFRLSHGLHN
jgi:hypothetical protein